MNLYRPISFILFMLLILSGCRSSIEPEEEEIESIFPMYIDENANNINNFVEQATHDDCIEKNFKKSNSTADPGHSFIDESKDSICDYAQDGSPTWYGPGFVDEDSDGVCDYWQEGGRGHHGGVHHGG